MNFLELRISKKEPGGALRPPGFVIREENGYFVAEAENGAYVRIRQRSAYPRTYCRQIDNTTVVVGYGPQDPAADDEFLQIIIDTGGNVAAKRDVFATLPLFYGLSSNVFALSNEYAYVAENLPQLSLNRAGVLEVLMPNPDRHMTLWSEICLLDERHILELSDCETIVIHKPRPRPWITSRDAAKSDTKAFERVMSNRLALFLDKFADQALAYEVSGGIDSATLPLFAASRGFIQPSSALGAMVFPGDFSHSQSQKLEELEAVVRLPMLRAVINPEGDYPLARILGRGVGRNFYSFDEIYTECLDKLAQQFEDRGVKLVATGVGGDELFENVLSAEQQLLYGQIERERRLKMQYPVFFTSRMRDEHVGNVLDQPLYPLPLLAVSLHGAQIARNNVYIAHDIWPVSPFADVGLYYFCQGLPAHVRTKKNILRAFHAAHGFPEIVYYPSQNEHFGVFFNDAFLSGRYVDAIRQLAAGSQTESLGLVDATRLAETYEDAVVAAGPTQDLLCMFTWLIAELNLQANTAKCR